MTQRFARLCLVAALSFAAQFVVAQPPATPPAAGAVSAVMRPDEPMDKFLLPNGDIDSVISALEMLTGRTALRPAQLPTATYNLMINRPTTKAEVVLALETVLSLNLVGVSPQGDRFLVITPLVSTKNNAPEMITGSAFEQAPSGKPAMKIFQLDFLRVAEFAPQIQGLLNPNFGGPVQLPNANSILVTDSVANLQRIEALLQAVDKPVAGGLKPKFYTLKNGAKASDVVSKIRTILGGPALTQQLGSSTTYSADDRANQIILVTDPRQYPLFDELILRLDVKSDPNTRNEVIYLKHAEAPKLASLLTSIVTGQTGAAQRANSQSVRPGTGVVGANPVPVPGQPVVTPVAPAANLSGLEGAGSSEFSSLMTIQPDERSNAIVVSGTVDDIRLIKDLVDKLDIILAQVRIEVVLAEVSLDDNATSGISQLGLTVAGDKVTGFNGTASAVAVTAGTITYRPAAGVSGPWDLAGQLNITTTPRKSNTSILSQPSITTSHAKEAKFFFGETRPVVAGVTSTPAAGAAGGFSSNSQINQQEIGTTITVTPLIGNDGSVQLKIAMDISDVINTVQIDNNTQYVIGKRTTNSFISAKSGEILYLSGMQKKKDSRSTSRLGPIPFIGDLFGTRNRENQRTELIFFFRPTVLTGTPVDNVGAFDRLKDLEQRDEVLKEVQPGYVPPKKSFLDKIMPK